MTAAKLAMLVALTAFSIPVSSHAGTLYAERPAQCEIGAGGQGVMSAGHGRFSLGEVEFVRQGALVALKDGWTEGWYAQMEEGMPGAPVVLRLKIADGVAEVVDEDGNAYRGNRC